MNTPAPVRQPELTPQSEEAVVEGLRGELPAQKERYLRLAATPTTAEPLRSGVEMTVRPTHQLLRRHGYQADDCAGQPFDPRRHEPVGSRCDTSKPDHAVIEVLQRGYRRGDDAFRPAQVVVNDLNAEKSCSHAG
jgi:molecular chaperone GrpE (heat shock protein)